MKRILLTACIITLAFAAVAPAAEVTLQLDPNNQVLDGYRIYQRVEGQDYGSQPTYTAPGTETTYTVQGLTAGVKYFFVARAFAGNLESTDSNEVEYIGADLSDTSIIDDGDPGTSSIGTWKISGGADPYGSQSLFSYDASAEYSFEKTISGRYEVAIWWTPYASRCSAVPVLIYDGDVLVDLLTVNQQQNGGQWNTLGAYNFANQAKVVVASGGEACSTCADAVQFTPIPVPCLNLLTPTGDSVADIQTGTYLIDCFPDLMAIIQPVPEDNDNPPYSTNASRTIYHGPSCRWYDPAKGIADPSDCPDCRPCKICDGK